MLGMTEAGSVCLASEDEGEQPEARRGSFGGPCPASRPRWSTRDGAPCRRAGGRAVLAGPVSHGGLLGRERHETFDLDGWFHTGDLHVDADGFFYFHGRSGDTIKTAGANVSPREVEAAS